MKSSFSSSLARRREDSDSRAETRVERAMEVILRATSSCWNGSDGKTCKTSSGRSKAEPPDSFDSIFFFFFFLGFAFKLIVSFFYYYYYE